MQVVFPTRVGVFLVQYHTTPACRCLPHARGGVSFGQAPTPNTIKSSPRAWGCFLEFIGLARETRVFPTRVGVFLPESGSNGVETSLPHARGGVSNHPSGQAADIRSSPRAWIETISVLVDGGADAVAPRAGAWIETAIKIPRENDWFFENN